MFVNIEWPCLVSSSIPWLQSTKYLRVCLFCLGSICS